MTLLFFPSPVRKTKCNPKTPSSPPQGLFLSGETASICPTPIVTSPSAIMGFRCFQRATVSGIPSIACTTTRRTRRTCRSTCTADTREAACAKTAGTTRPASTATSATSAITGRSASCSTRRTFADVSSAYKKRGQTKELKIQDGEIRIPVKYKLEMDPSFFIRQY